MKTFVKKSDINSRTVLAAVISAVCAVMFLCSFATSSNVIAAGLVEIEEGEGEWDVFETKLPETTREIRMPRRFRLLKGASTYCSKERMRAAAEKRRPAA